ncbi:MAG: translocation/assembly module TamB [Treponema sp.]|nr:translocation/assembly module TamB [Treponema sp.]
MDKAQFRRRLGLEALIFLALVGTSAVILRPLQDFFGERMDLLKESLILRGEDALGRTIRYGSAGSSIVGRLDIRDISLYRPGEDESSLRLDRITVRYSLWDLMRGKFLESLRELVIEGPRLIFDFELDRDLIELFTLQSDRAKRKDIILPRTCLVTVNNGTLYLIKNERSLEVSGFSLDGKIRDGIITLDGKWHILASLAGLAGALESVSVDGSISGSFTGDLSEGGLGLGISAVRGNTFELHDLHLDLSVEENKITLQKSRDELPFALYFNYALDTGVMSGSFEPAGFVPADIIRFSGDWENLNPWFNARLTGRASFIFDPPQELRYQFDLSGGSARLGPDAILRDFDLKGEGSSSQVFFDHCYLGLKNGSASYAGDLIFDPLLPNGILSFSNFSVTEIPGEGISGTLRLNRSGRALAVSSENLSMGGVALSSLSGRLVWENAGCSYGLKFSRLGAAEPGVVSLEGSYDRRASGEPGQAQGAIALEAFSTADLFNMMRPLFSLENFPLLAGDLIKQVTLSTEVFVSTDFSHISYNAPRFTAVLGDLGNIFEASLSGTDRRFEISDGQITWKKRSVDLELGVDFSDPGDIAFLVQLGYLDFTYYFEGDFFDRRTLNLRGSYGLSAALNSDDSGGYAAYVDVQSMPVPYGGETALLTLDVSMRYDAPSLWNLYIDALELKSPGGAVHPPTKFRVEGQANQEGLNLNLISYEDSLGSLSGSAEAKWDNDFSSAAGFLALEDGKTQEQILVHGSYTGGLLEFKAELEKLRLGRFISGRRDLLASAEILGSWTSSSNYSLNLNLKSLESGSGDISASATGYMDADQIIVSSLKAGYGGLQGEIPSLIVDRNNSKLTTELVVDGMVKEHPIGLSLALDLSFDPIDSWFGFAGAFRSFYAVIDLRDGYIKSLHTEEPYYFTFSRLRGEDSGEGTVVRLEGGPRNMIRFELLENGNFFAGFSAPSPLQTVITGTLTGGEIDALARDVYIDLPVVWDLLPTENIVNITSGFMTGETRISGSVMDPEFSGSGWGSGVRLRIPRFLSGEIGPASGAIALEGSGVSFGPIAAHSGDGQGKVSAAFRFNRWIPSYDIDVDVEREDYIPFDFDLAGVKARGDISGNLKLRMENNETLFITGNLNVLDTEITLNNEEINRINSGAVSAPNMDIVTDIHISAGRRVEFLWPSADFPLIQAYGEAGTGIQVSSDTRIPRFTLAGDVNLRGGEIFYYQRNFYIREGQIVFDGNNPTIDPRISARAEIRDRNDDGPVTISMIVDNAPLRSLTPRFESSPALSQLEIYSLLGMNPMGDIAEEQADSTVLLRSAADIFTQFTVVRQAERQIRNILGLDMFSLRTQALQNAIFQVLGTQDPVEQNRSVLGNFFDNTAVFMGKYLGSDLFLHAMISLRYDEFRSENGGIRFEPDIGLDLRTPLMDIQWNFSPRARDLENLYVNNHSVSLVWRWVL